MWEERSGLTLAKTRYHLKSGGEPGGEGENTTRSGPDPPFWSGPRRTKEDETDTAAGVIHCSGSQGEQSKVHPTLGASVGIERSKNTREVRFQRHSFADTRKKKKRAVDTT